MSSSNLNCRAQDDPRIPATLAGWRGTLFLRGREGAMAIPTIEQFREYFDLMVAPLKQPFEMPTGDFGEPRGITVDFVANFLSELEIQRRERECLCQKMPAHAWFFTDRSVIRAIKIARGRKKVHSDDEFALIDPVVYAKSMLDDARKYVLEHEMKYFGNEDLKGDSRETVVDFFLNKKMSSMLMDACTEDQLLKYFDLGWMQAFFEYFEATSVPAIVSALKDLEKAAVDLVESASRYQKILDGLHKCGMAEGRIKRAERLPDGFAPFVPCLDSLPIRRNDRHARERLLVYRLWGVNMRTFRTAKTEAIAELLCVEGIEHQYDTRTVEKLCAEFTGMKRSKRTL